jgi:hypothetical protein
VEAVEDEADENRTLERGLVGRGGSAGGDPGPQVLQNVAGRLNGQGVAEGGDESPALFIGQEGVDRRELPKKIILHSVT